MSKPPPRLMMDDEDSRVECPVAQRPKTRQALGQLEDEPSKALVAPRASQGPRAPQSTAAGLRAAARERPLDEKAATARAQVRERVEDSLDARKKRVWDKLDSAKRQADEKLSRLRGFQPVRGGGKNAV